MKRDEIVFNAARKKNIPITMVTSGGYQVSNNSFDLSGFISFEFYPKFQTEDDVACSFMFSLDCFFFVFAIFSFGMCDQS